jgi:hypothetical protein
MQDIRYRIIAVLIVSVVGGAVSVLATAFLPLDVLSGLISGMVAGAVMAILAMMIGIFLSNQRL